MLKIVIKDLEDTKRLAKIVSEGIENRLVLLLNGDLAAGKTTFTKYLAEVEIISNGEYEKIEERIRENW